jgi:hypothetical protein
MVSTLLVSKSEGKHLLERYRSKWENSTRKGFKDVK